MAVRPFPHARQRCAPAASEGFAVPQSPALSPTATRLMLWGRSGDPAPSARRLLQDSPSPAPEDAGASPEPVREALDFVPPPSPSPAAAPAADSPAPDSPSPAPGAV